MTQYTGSELELFADATRWKNYWASRLLPHVHGRVLEVGAGLGANIKVLSNSKVESWHALEPDPELAACIGQSGPFPITVQTGTVQDVSETDFDTVLYIDVLEHIEDDAAEVQRAASRLRPGGCLIVLAPAHHALYSPFDEAIGHFRRYDRVGIARLTTRDLRLLTTEYLDCVGMLASLANRLLLRQSSPGQGQIRIWDRLMVPCSRLLDPLTLRRLGKTIIAIWEKSPPPS